MNAGKLYGRSIAFPPRIGPDGRWAWSDGPQNIQESIQIILQTEMGQRVMLRPFGAGLGRYLFEPNTSATRRRLQEQVDNALRLWEPRIQLQAVQATGDDENPQQVTITIDYKLVATGDNQRLAFAVTLGS